MECFLNFSDLCSAVAIFNGQTFRDGADFKRPISDGQLLNYEDTLLYVGGLEGYQEGRCTLFGRMNGWMGRLDISSSLKRVFFPDVFFSGSVASESIFILDGVSEAYRRMRKIET